MREGVLETVLDRDEADELAVLFDEDGSGSVGREVREEGRDGRDQQERRERKGRGLTPCA